VSDSKDVTVIDFATAFAEKHGWSSDVLDIIPEDAREWAPFEGNAHGDFSVRALLYIATVCAEEEASKYTAKGMDLDAIHPDYLDFVGRSVVLAQKVLEWWEKNASKQRPAKKRRSSPKVSEATIRAMRARSVKNRRTRQATK